MSEHIYEQRPEDKTHLYDLDLIVHSAEEECPFITSTGTGFICGCDKSHFYPKPIDPEECKVGIISSIGKGHNYMTNCGVILRRLLEK